MKHDPMISVCHLQLFAEGGAAGGDGQGSGVTAPDAGVHKGVTAPDAGVHKGVKANPLADVKYGVQPQEQAPAAEVQQNTEPKVDRKAEFEKLIKGEYKDLYDERMNDTLRKRLKGQSEAVERYETIAPVLELLAKRYGVDPADAKALSKAIEDDNALYEEESLEKGIPIPQLKNIKKMERENAYLKRQAEERTRKEQADKQYAIWMQQAQEAKAIYPQLDLDIEVKNPQFMRLLGAGVDVGAAYLVLHKDEVIPAAMQHVAQQVEQKLAGKIAAGGDRPTENGAKPQNGPVVKNDVSSMTKADRAEINRRVMAGDRISFS